MAAAAWPLAADQLQLSDESVVSPLAEAAHRAAAAVVAAVVAVERPQCQPHAGAAVGA
jgi:hypothetical protein